MSTTETQNTTDPTPVDLALAPFVDPIQTDLVSLRKKDAEAETLRRRLGKRIGAAVSAMTAEGASAEEAQEKILATVGPDYKWTTVQAWIRAHVVYESLSKDSGRDSLGVDALNAVGRVSEKDGEREAFVTAMVADGVTGAHRVRKAVTNHKQPNGPKKKGNAEQAADLVKKFGSTPMASVVRDLVAGGYNVEDVAACIRWGILIGRNGRDLEKFHTDAIEEILSMTPEAVKAASSS